MGLFVKENNWKTAQTIYKKDNQEWVQYTESTISNYILNGVFDYGGNVGGLHTLIIGAGGEIVRAVSCQYIALYDNVEVTSSDMVWSILSGSEYATIDNSGFLTVDEDANENEVVITCSYRGLFATKHLTVTYVSGSTSDTESETTVVVDPSTGAVTETTTITTTTTDSSGNTSTQTTITETVTNQDGSSSSTETQTNVNTDGSSTSSSTTTNYDNNGDITGSSSNDTTINADGSSTSSTTNYNSSGDPVTGENVMVDTGGNVDTQNLEYNENGDPVVTGYTIDTSASGGQGKEITDGVNTEYYAFDLTRGFEMNIEFTIDFANQPPNQNEYLHNILTMKRATPSPWYGFQLRQSVKNKYIELGTQFSTGNNTNTTIRPSDLVGNVGHYKLKIIYDPTAETNKFVCTNELTGATVLTRNATFPDLPELRYLTTTLGCALDSNGDPYRYSNINVTDFSIVKLPGAVAEPVITCNNNFVTITCETPASTIYYRFNQSGEFAQYYNPIEIHATTIVEAYATKDGVTSTTAIETCTFVGVADPVITCDGETVTITCETADASIFYRLNQTGEFDEYTEPFDILADTIVEAYAEKDGTTSSTVIENCEYNPEHDYSTDYLTFRVTGDGDIAWQSYGTGYTRTIAYSVNNGPWQTITSDLDPDYPTIPVVAGDVVRFRGTNSTYAGSNTNYSGFGGTTAEVDIEGNIMSLIYGGNFLNQTTLSGSYNFCSLFKLTNVVSAENLILPATTMTPHCYRALFANSTSLEVPPALPATTLAVYCYCYMFRDCAIVNAPDLLAPTLVTGCYVSMFNNCLRLTHIKCLATNIEALPGATANWVDCVNTTGIFVKDANAEWVRGGSGIPNKWTIVEEGLKKPTISCNGLAITLTCSTQDADIYYRLGGSGTYTLYTAPISINSDTFIEAYSELDGATSPVVSDTCIYDDGIEEPVIYCDGEYITISCDTIGANIYYRLGQTGSFTLYEDAIVISADTVCEAYAEIDGRQSLTVSETCIYDDTLKTPIIECDGEYITLTCRSVGADIYYRLDQQGNYALYSAPIQISADTYVEAYSERGQETSTVVEQNCIYNPVHDYSLDYLTFRVLSPGTIKWNSIGSGQAKTIQYSLNDGAWTTITASSSTTINVAAGDKVRFKGSNTSYAKDKSNYSGFEGGTASFNIEGNIMSLIYGDNFEGQTTMTGTYNFCSIFKLAECVSAENLVLPATTLTNYCYRAMFSKCPSLTTAPKLPATTLGQGCYWYMFEECSITSAPELLAPTLVRECYGYMFTNCRSLNYIKCMATGGFSTYQCKQGWVQNVASSGSFVKDSTVTTSTWTTGNNGIPTGWLVYDNVSVSAPVISCDEYNNVTITCDTQGAIIYYRLNREGNFVTYSTPIVISEDTVVESYATLSGQDSLVITQTCRYISDDPYEASNRDLTTWTYNNQEITVPYSVNASDGHSASYAKGIFNFETSFALRQADPTYLWFQHADQSAVVYVDNVQVEKHWGGYTAFFVDISNFVHTGTNNIKVSLKNNEGNYLAPASGDFNFNATLGKVKLFTSPYVPDPSYGYDGFHVNSTVFSNTATVTVRTKVPTDASIVCTITDGVYNHSETQNSNGQELTFVSTISNPHLWNGTIDPHLYTITLEIYHNNELYHRYVRPYGLRFYDYVINDSTIIPNQSYTGFLLNGSPYLLRGVCMHDDVAGKANALNDADYNQEFSIIQELGCNFLRLAHYPHPKEVYDRCDQLGIIVQTEGPCVNKLQSTMPADYYTHLTTQYIDMVSQHYNHPCILFWGLSNETTTDDATFGNTKINEYTTLIKNMDPERWVGLVMSHNYSNPASYYNYPNVDWYGCNIYVGWYIEKASNDPTNQLNTRVNNIINNANVRKALAFSEYGAGGTQNCHSEDPQTTTTKGNYERHDIEYQMWLHEGHIATIRNFPQLLFTSQWQLFDIAVANRNEGYTVCLDGETTSVNDKLRRLNNKGLVERDHVTKKDTFYVYKAEWSNTAFVHICGKDYTRKTARVIKCYTNDDNNGQLAIYVNGTFVENTAVTDHIALFTSTNYSSGDVIRVDGLASSDTFTFA